jgi:tetratricopeptide (TPR) repeat protein
VIALGDVQRIHLMVSRLWLQSQSAVSIRLVVALGLLSIVMGGCSSDEDRVENFIERGEQYIEDGMHEEAIIEFKNVLQIEPENATAHEALSLAYLTVKKPREAYWEMSETVRLDPDNVEARLRYGTISAALRDFDLSSEQAEAVLQMDPTNSAAFILRGAASESREDFERAESDFRSAITNEPNGAAYRFLLSGFYERRGDVDESEKVLRELIEVEESFLAVRALARMLVRTEGRKDEALAVLKRTVELSASAPLEGRDPQQVVEESLRASLLFNVLREEAVQTSHLLLANYYLDQDDFDKTIEVLEEGISLSETKVELIYQMASFYRRNGMPDKEDELIRRATVESPDSMTVRLVLSAYLGRQGDLTGALKAARDAVAIEPENSTALLREAELLVDLGYRDSDSEMIQSGRKLVDAVLEDQPDSPEGNFVRAKVEMSSGDIEAAKQSLETVLQARPNWAQARFVLGSALVASGELGRARVELARAIEIDPQLDRARMLLVRLHAQLGEHEFAIELGREYLRSYADDVDIRIIVGQSLIRVGRGEDAYEEVSKIPEDKRGAAALFALGRLDIAFGRLEKGADQLRRADQLVPGNPQVLRELLRIDRQKEQLEDSVERVATALAANPDESEIVEIDAEVKMYLGDEAGARTAFTRAIELNARNITAQLALAALEGRSGNVEGMIAVMERAAQAAPESSDLQYRLALAYDGNGRRADAIDAYEKSISLNADLAAAKNNLAYLLTESGGDLDRALELAQQAKEQLPDDANSADTLGWVLLKRGVPSAAIGYLQEAAERFPSNAAEAQGIVRNHLGEAYEKNSEVAKALVESRKSVDYFEQLSKLATERGIDFAEPSWAQEARERIARLAATS